MNYNTAVSMNRQLLEGSPIFGMRGTNVKWPTIRKAWLTDESVAHIQRHVTQFGRSIIFLDGIYNTNLNRWAKKPPEERAVFFEYMVRHPRTKGAIFLLCWIGNFHNGSIYHCAYQYPQVRCWEEYGDGAEEFFEKAAFKVYQNLAIILYEYSEYPMDAEVKKFLQNGDDA